MKQFFMLLMSLVLINTTAFAAPVLNLINPTQVKRGEIVTLIGSGFTKDAAGAPVQSSVSLKYKILLDEETRSRDLRPATSEDTRITIVMPDLDITGNITIEISNSGGKAEKTVNYEMSKPEIKDFVPKSAKSKENVMLIGSDFYSYDTKGNPIAPEVFMLYTIDGHEQSKDITPNFIDNKLITITLPDLGDAQDVSLNIKNAHGRSTKLFDYKILRPELITIQPTEAKKGDTVVLMGNGFFGNSSDGNELKANLKYTKSGKNIIETMTLIEKKDYLAKFKMPSYDYEGDMDIEVTNTRGTAISKIKYLRKNNANGFSNFPEHNDYDDVFFKLNIGYEYATINSAFDKGFPRIGLLFYTKYFDKNSNSNWAFGMHNIINAYLTSSAESSTNIDSSGKLKDFGDKRSLEVETELFMPIYKLTDRKLFAGPVGIVGMKKIDDKTKSDGKYYAGLRFALCPESYAEVLYGKTEGVGSKRIEARAQFPLVNSFYVGAIGNFGVVDRDSTNEADSIRLYVSWNISPEYLLDKVFGFAKDLASK